MRRMNSPKLTPPCTGWREDLPGPYEPPVVEPTLGLDTPNYQDEVFLELPRTLVIIRGVMIWFVPVCIISLVALSWVFFSIKSVLNFAMWLMFVSILLSGFWSAFFFWQLDVVTPRDLPLRFNRARQRIYAYNFKYRWWNPFERWHVIPVAYDWSQVRAERWWVSAGTTFRCGVELSIVKPGTNEVIDRFSLTAMGANEHAWAYVCTYMQQGPDALPPPDEPWDHNDVLWCNVAMLLAPKVEWPADMDFESRTAPYEQP